MACEQTAVTPIGTIPMLGCCANLPTQVFYDQIVFRLDTDFDLISPNLNPQHLQTVFGRCLAEPFIEGSVLIWKPARAEERRVQAQPLDPGDGCFPAHPALETTKAEAAHGGSFGQGLGEMRYFASKVRVRLPFLRRWCVTSCQHIQPISQCSNPLTTICNPTIGNSTKTIFPATAEMIITPDALAPVGYPGFGFTYREYTVKLVEFDTEPPSSPFCGLP